MRRLLMAITVCVLVAFLAGLPVLAHGGGKPQLTNEPVGAYLLSAWTSPDPAVVGKVHVTAALADASSGAAVTEPAIHVTAAQAGGPAVEADATHANAAVPIFYEADMELPATGEWQFSLAVAGPAGTGTATFILPVRPAGPNWLPIGLVGVGVVLVAAVGWRLLRSRRDAAHPAG